MVHMNYQTGRPLPTDATLTDAMNGGQLATTVDAPIARDLAFEQGAKVGRYLILNRLGAGGMGVVYCAYDPELDRRVALKFLTASARDQGSRARLLREAQAMAKLAHPNVVTVFEIALYEDDIFVAMELVSGVTLRQWLAERPRAWREIVDVFVAVGTGLAEAHAVGLVHRDLKPDNIMIGQDGRVRVMDFGLARATAEDSLRPGNEAPTQQALSLELTRTGARVGTPAYMAPEQWNGEPTDARTDQFSFCVSLWEALYGQRPFAGGTATDLMTEVTDGRVATPRNTKRAPPWLRQAIQRGLAVSPASRWPAMAPLLAAIVPKRSRFIWPAIALTGSLVTAVSLALLNWAWSTDIPSSVPEVEALTEAARAAATHANWVWPPTDDLDETAFRKVLELEQMEGEGAEVAAARAKELRSEFSTMLVSLGDSNWERDGGRPFARDFYLQAITFDRDNTQARERSGATPGMVAEFIEKAAQGSFSEAEIRAAAPLIALAEPNEDARQEKLRALVEDADAAAASSTASIDRLIASTRGKPHDGLPKVDAAAGAAPPGTSVRHVHDALTTAIDMDQPIKRDNQQSDPEVKGSTDALAGGDAEAHVDRALGFNNRSAAALIGLSDLEFARGAYQRAAEYAEKAITAAPRNGAYHLRLGDAYFMLIRYIDARRAYERAKELGVWEAGERLERLKAKLGYR